MDKRREGVKSFFVSAAPFSMKSGNIVVIWNMRRVICCEEFFVGIHQNIFIDRSFKDNESNFKMRVILWRGGFLGKEGAFFFHLSNKRDFRIRLLAFGRFGNISHHNDVFNWTNWSHAFVLHTTTVVFAVRTFIWAIVHDMPEEMAKTTGVVVFGSRAMDRIKMFMFRIPEGPFESTLVIKQYSLLLRKEFKIFLSAGLTGNVRQSRGGPIILFHEKVWDVSHKVLWREF